jgi:hypothetical protein
MPFLIMFSMLLIIFVGAYAGSQPNLPNVQNTVSGILANWPVISTKNCSFSQDGPTGNCAPQDIVFLGAIWLLASIGSFFYRVALVGVLISQMASIFGQFTTIPFVGPIFVGFIIIFALYAWSQIRASHHGMN